MTRRRDVIAIGLLLAAPLVAVRACSGAGQGDFRFKPLRTPPGFRRLDGGDASAAAVDPLIGLGTRGPVLPPLPPADLCPVLFGDDPLPPGVVPVASFSDYYCPFCRVLTQRLAARDGQGIRVAWHELPLLGTASGIAARAALAADLQGAYAAFHARLMRAAFQPTEAYLRALSDGLGLDTARFLSDMDGPGVARRLEDSGRAAALLRIGATPALVVGRTLVSGLISEARLDALVEIERAEGPPPC